MTKTLFYKDAYQKELQTRVDRVEGTNVLLEETIFFPQTSTEPGDIGKINDCKVVGLKKDGDKIWHMLNKTPLFKDGDTVNLQIDWNKRYKMMRLHSALHLWAGVFDSSFKERAVAGVVKSKSAYLVFKHALTDETIQKALDHANNDIKQGLDIKTYDDEKRKGFRWCQIGSYIPIPCGGVHLKNSQEIGKIVCTEKAIENGKQKLTFVLE